MEIAQISIGTGLDLTGAMRDLQRFGAMPKADVKIAPTVDHSQLTALNKHLDSKQRHIRQVAADFKANVIRPVVDDKALTQLNKSLDATQTRLVNVVRLAQQLKGIGNISVSASTSSSSGSGQQVNEKMADAIGKAVARHSKPGLAGRAAAFAGKAAGGVGAIAGQVGSSLLFGVSQEVTKNFGKGLSASIEKSIGGSLGSTELVGNKIGDAMSGAIAKRLSTSLPKEIQEVIKNAIGEEDILKAGLFEKSRQRGNAARRVEPIQNEAIAQRRDLLRQRFEAREAAGNISIGIQQTQSDVQRRERVRDAYQGKAARAASAGASLETLAKYDGVIGALNNEIIQLIEREQALTDSLGTANEGLRRLDEEIKKSKEIRQQVSPQALPDFYQQALEQIGGKNALKNAPKLVVNDAKLKAEGSKAAYGIESNTLQITREMDEALKTGRLTIEQMTTLFHELQHAIQYDFGSTKGIEASAQGRILNKPAAPSASEVKAIAPLINRYDPKERLSEIDAEVTGRRMAAKAYEAQEKQRAKAALEAKVGYGGTTGSSVAEGQINGVAAQLQGIRSIAKTLEVDVSDDIGAIANSFAQLSNELQSSVDKILGVDKLSSSEINALSDQVSKQFEQLFKLQSITTKYQKQFVVRGRALQTGKTVRDGGQEKIGDVKEILDRVSATSFDLNIAVGKKFGTIQTAYEALSEELNQIYETAKANKTISTDEVRKLFEGKAEQIEALEVAALKYKKQFDTRAKATKVYRAVADPTMQAARVAGGTAIGLGRAARTITDMPQTQAFLKAAGGATKALGAVAKTGYAIAAGFESVALDLIPMGRSIKGAAKQIALPAAIYAGATHMLPGGAAMAEGVSSLASGALSPLSHAASGGATDAAIQIIKHLLPDMFGMQSGAIGGATSIIETATTAATNASANALAAIMGGKAIQTAGSMSIKAAAGQVQKPFVLPAAREKELLPAAQNTTAIAKTQQAEIEKQNRKLAIKAARAAGATIRKSLDDAENTIDVIAQAVKSGSSLASGGLEQAKKIGASFSEAYAKIKSEAALGNDAVAKAYAENLIEMADQANAEISKIVEELKAGGAEGFASQLGGTLQGIKGQISRKKNLSKTIAEKAGNVQPYINVQSSDAGEIEKQRLDLTRLKGTGNDDLNKLLENAENAADKAEAAIGRIGKTSEKAFNQSIKGLNEVIEAFERGEPPISIFKDVLGGLGGVGKTVLTGLAAFSALSFIAPMFNDFAKESSAAAMEFEKFERSMTFVSGSAAKTQETFAALRSETQAMGTDFSAAIEGQTKLAAATKGTSLEGAATDQIASASRQTASVFGFNEEEARGVNKAFSDMLSKGKIQAEELRGQLGDRLPGAFQMFARSIGVTTAQLDKMMMQGEVTSDMLVKFAGQLKAETSTGVAGAANSAQGSLNRFNNEVYAMQVGLGKNILPVQSLGLGVLTEALKVLQVVLPIATTAAIGFAVKGLASIAVGSLASGTGIATLGKGLLALPGTLVKAAAAFAPMAAQALVFVAIADAIGVMGKMFGETEGASKDFADSATKGMENYLRLTGEATDETKKLADSLKSLPKSYGEDTMLGGIARGIAGDRGTQFLRQREEDLSRGGYGGTGADIARLFGRMSGRGESGTGLFESRAMNEANDLIAQNQRGNTASSAMQQRLQDQLSRYQQGGGSLRSVRDVDIKMRDLQARRGLLGAGDDAGRAAIDKEYQQLTKDREQLSTEINALNAQVRADVEARKAASKQIEDALAQGGLSPAKQKELQAVLEANTKEIERGEASLKEYGKAINTAIVGAAKLESQLEGINTAAAFRDNRGELAQAQMQQAIALDNLTPGQTQSATTAAEQAATAQNLANLNQTMAQLNSLLQSPTTSRAFGLSGLSPSSTSADIGQYISDFSGDTESEEYKILQQAQKQKQQLEQLELQAAQSQAQLAQSQAQTKESIRQTTKEINDFVRGIGEQIEDIGRTIQQQDLDTQIQQTKNDLKRNLSGFSDRFFGDFIGGLDSLIDLINEPMKRMNDAQGTIAGMMRSLQESQRSAAEMARNAQSGASASYAGVAGMSASGGNVAPVGVRTLSGQEYGASRDGGSRAHAGEDFDLAAGQNSVSYLGGVVQEIQDWGKWGKAAVIFNARLGVTEIVAEMKDTFIQVGQQIAAGAAVGSGGDDIGGVQHTEIHRGQGRTGQTVDPLSYYRSIGVDPARGQVYGGGGASASSASNRDRYLNRLAYLESDFNANATGYTGVEGGGRAQGAFQFTPITVQDAQSAGIGDPRQGSIVEQAKKAFAFIQRFHPEAAAAIEAGNFAEADRQLRGRWTSLPGGGEQSTKLSQADQFLRGEGLQFTTGGGSSSGTMGTGQPGGTISVPGADTSSLSPALSQLGGSIQANTESILAQVAAQNEGSAIALRQGIQSSQQKLEEARRTIIDEARQYDERYQDSILAAFGDSSISQAIQQLTSDSRDIEASTKQMALTIKEAELSLGNLRAARDRIANDPTLTPLKELIPGMDASIAEYEQQINRIGLARDREQRILMDRRNAIVDNLESSGREQLTALQQQTEDLQIKQQAMNMPDAGLRDLVAARAERMSLMREFESATNAIDNEIANTSKGIERLKAEGFKLDSDEIAIAQRRLENLNAQRDQLEQGNGLQLQLIDQSQLELLRQYNKEQQAAIVSANVEDLNNRGDVFGSNELQRLTARNELMDQYRMRLESINQLEIQMQGQEGYTAESFMQMRQEAEKFSEVSLDNLKQQFPDLATAVNGVAFQAFSNLGGSISALIKGTGTLEDVFDDFTSSIIDGLSQMAVKWAASQLFNLFMGIGGGGSDVSGPMTAGGSSLAGGFDNGGLIPGRFSGKPDQHIARVNPGEYVMSRESVSRIGVSNLNLMNRYDDGGFVGEAPRYRDFAAKSGDRQSNQPVKVEYSVTEINSVRYVSEEQFQRGLQATSEQTEKRMNRSLKNSPSYRKGIGI